MSTENTVSPEFEAFSKIARLSRNCVVTEKIDGTNAQVLITEDGTMLAGSRSRWLEPVKDKDNFGFATWVKTNEEALRELGPGRHFGEWWGSGIQRTYGLKEKRFSLFNTGRWSDENTPECVSVVPVLYEGVFDTQVILSVLDNLEAGGSVAAPGFMSPEGVVVYHTASGSMFKKTLKGDGEPKSLAAPGA